MRHPSESEAEGIACATLADGGRPDVGMQAPAAIGEHTTRFLAGLQGVDA